MHCRTFPVRLLFFTVYDAGCISHTLQCFMLQAAAALTDAAKKQRSTNSGGTPRLSALPLQCGR